MYSGNIDFVRDGEVVGWLAGVDPHAVPAILVDGVPAQNIEIHLRRDDVSERLGLATGCGFRARILQRVHGPVAVEMWAAGVGEVVQVCAQTINVHANANAAGPAALARAAEIARRPGSVAIAVWEGSHNPIGRAKVLYDVVAKHRPTVLFAFTFGAFGTTLWPPIANAAMDVVLIPYAERFAYADLFREQRLAFDTVWICKDRLPSFELADMVAHERTRFILDLDDDEENFARNTSRSAEPYGTIGINKAAFLRGRVASRTVASRALQERFGGRIVRHVRAPRPAGTANGAVVNGHGGAAAAVGTDPLARQGRPFRFIFMGTVRPHKNLEAAARALALYRFRTGMDVSLTVGGVFDPPTLRDTLAAAGASVIDAVDADALIHTIAEYDAVLAGYPSALDAAVRISDWQISSKVGDALAAGRPVLVPAGPSTADLADIPGVMLFDEAGFDAAVGAAVAETRPIALPDDFTPDHAFRVFLEADADAATALSPARRPFATRGAEPAVRPSLLLLWKQNDAGLFGRRVDQIARIYAHMHPDHDVHLLEIDPYIAGRRPAARTEMTSLDALSGKLAASKELSRREGSILHRTLSYADAGVDVSLSRRMLAYLQANRLTPSNTVAVVFPFNRRFNAILNLLEPYPVIADIVDHQLIWEAAERRPHAVQQYFALSRLARFEVFNSEANRQAFAAANLTNPAASPHVIPNWYMLPPEVELPAPDWDERRGVFYSGNFNDRIDWPLLTKVAQFVAARGEALHLVGSGEYAADRLCELVGSQPHAVFHGAMHETDTLWLGASSRAAIVPHRLDQHSAHMDPIKVRMYQLLGLPCVSTAVPGPRHDGKTLFVANDHDAFLATLAAIVDSPGAPSGGNMCAELSADGLRYIDLIEVARRDRRAASSR